MPITIVVEVQFQHRDRSPFEDTKSCLKALLHQLEKASPSQPLPKENSLYWDSGVKIGHYGVYFPMKSRSVMDLIRLTHYGEDLVPLDEIDSPSVTTIEKD